VRELLDPDVAWTIIGDTPVSQTFHGHDGFENGAAQPRSETAIHQGAYQPRSPWRGVGSKCGQHRQ